jgi:hypothetical protein
VSVQDRCMVCAKHTIGPKIIMDTPDRLLGYEAQQEAHFGPFGDSPNLDARKVHGLCQTYHLPKNHFGCTR